MGSVVSARRRLRPGNSTRACTQASGTPRSSASTVAESEQTSESRKASSPSGEPSSRSASFQGALTARPSKGSAKRAAPSPPARARPSGGRSRLGRAEAEARKDALTLA